MLFIGAPVGTEFRAFGIAVVLAPGGIINAGGKKVEAADAVLCDCGN